MGIFSCRLRPGPPRLSSECIWMYFAKYYVWSIDVEMYIHYCQLGTNNYNSDLRHYTQQLNHTFSYHTEHPP